MAKAPTTDRTKPPPADDPAAALPRPAFESLPFSPWNPPAGLHAKPIAKSRVDRAGLDRALRQVGETPGA